MNNTEIQLALGTREKTKTNKKKTRKTKDWQHGPHQLNVLKRIGKYLNKHGRLTIYYSFI